MTVLQQRITLTDTLCVVLLLLRIASATPQCKAWLGRPDFQSCRQLLFGQRSQSIDFRGIENIDRKDHLFHTWIEYLQNRPVGVTRTQFQNMVEIPQPRYPQSWVNTNPPGSVPQASRWGPVPWSNGERAAGCKIMLVPILNLNGQYLWDTGRYKPIAETGGRINSDCVRPIVAGGRGMGGLDFVGDLSRMILVIYEPDSEWDREKSSLPQGKLVSMDEQEPGDEESDDEYEPAPKRVKQEPHSAAGSSTQVAGGQSVTQSLSGNIGSDWLLQHSAVKSILPVTQAAQQLVSFYGFVVDKASAQIEAGAPELRSMSFNLGDLSLVLSGSDVIHWDWIINFAMSMEDFTNLGNTFQYASSVKSELQQNTIKAELLLGGVGAE
ncbi:MAG: hypothetical protein LQ343_005999 [Gyalolechia ehrenbergii]|nr:MAG: hypothetical protein LQ343_005999 [Gyalolechia ehrenbergii]